MTIGPDPCGREEDHGDLALIQFSTMPVIMIFSGRGMLIMTFIFLEEEEGGNTNTDLSQYGSARLWMACIFPASMQDEILNSCVANRKGK